MRGAEGDDVRWPLWAARHAGTLKNWIEDTEQIWQLMVVQLQSKTSTELKCLVVFVGLRQQEDR